MVEMVLTVEEEALIRAVRALPREDAQKIIKHANQLADLHNSQERERQKILDQDAGLESGFVPITIPGERLSETVVRERR